MSGWEWYLSFASVDAGNGRLQGGLVFIKDENIIPFAGGSEKAMYGAGCKEVIVDDAFKKLFGIMKHFPGTITQFTLLLEHFGVGSVDIPCPEIGHPIDIGDQLFKGGLMIASAKKLRCGRGVVFPVKFESVFSSGFEWKEDTLFLRGGMCFAQCFIFASDGAAIADILCKKRLHYGDGARSIGNVYAESAITRFNFDGSMFFAGCGSTNESGIFMFARSISRATVTISSGGSDESRKPDDLGSPFTGFFENGFPGNHNANVFDFEVVAGKYNADNIFSDVMHIAFYGGKQDFPAELAEPSFSSSIKGSR